MREDHHTFEPHTESAADHFCDRCFSYHSCFESCEEDEEEEMIDFEQVSASLPLRVEVDGGEAVHRVTVWKVPRDATEEQVKEAMNYWIEAEYCQHEGDCCGYFYAGKPQLLGGRTYWDNDTEVVFVLQTDTLNV